RTPGPLRFAGGQNDRSCCARNERQDSDSGHRPRQPSLADPQTFSTRRVEARVMLQDPPLELVELGAGLEAELIREPLPGCSQSGQRVGLTAGSVERKHQLTQEPLPQRMLTGEALELRHEFRAFAAREPRV